MPVADGIVLPRDHYAHANAPSEWWWHIGTLVIEGRIFGFEINAAMQSPPSGLTLFSQIMLTDVENQTHYQATTTFPYEESWAQTDPSQPWSVQLGTGEPGSISMQATAENPCDMTVQANFVDSSGTSIAFSLRLTQDYNEVPPLLVWGDGVYQSQPNSPTPLLTSNFYYSLTKLAASGVISINGDEYEVGGTTWMDHEYGMFGVKTKWVLQDAQLSNGIDLSNSSVGVIPVSGSAMKSIVTVRWPEGNSTSHYSLTTPGGEQWHSPDGTSYFQKMDVVIPDLKTQLTFVSLYQDQEFPVKDSPVYEGVASVTGDFMGESVTGCGWIEQALSQSVAS